MGISVLSTIFKPQPLKVKQALVSMKLTEALRKWYARTRTIPKLERGQFLKMQKPDQPSSPAKKEEDFLNSCLRKHAAVNSLLLIHFSFELY